jgi:hypothetical protein
MKRSKKMANISSASGDMTLKGAWTPAAISNLNKIASGVWAKWYYDIQLDTFEAEDTSGELTAVFSGNGRWTFDSNLEALDRWTTDDLKDNLGLSESYRDLVSEMHNRDLNIEVSFSDEEGGCMVLYRQDGILSSDGERLSYTVTSEEHFNYNWKNYIEVTGDEDVLYELVQNLCRHLEVDEDEDSYIKCWVMDRTSPHSYDLGSLSDEQQAEFNEMFSNTSAHN